MNVKEYSLKLTQLSKYMATIVVNPRARMNFFLLTVSRFVEK